MPLSLHVQFRVHCLNWVICLTTANCYFCQFWMETWGWISFGNSEYPLCFGADSGEQKHQRGQSHFFLQVDWSPLTSLLHGKWESYIDLPLKVRNERCVLDGGMSHILPPSSKSDWASFSASVPIGSSTLQWYLYSENYYEKNSEVTQFKLKSVEITGRPATLACAECKPGYYAEKPGSDKCHKCPENTISERKASSCSPCANGMFSCKFVWSFRWSTWFFCSSALFRLFSRSALNSQ